MNYYILDSNNEIELFDTDKKRLQTTLKFKPDLADAKIKQTTKEIVELDGKFVFADEHTDELLEKSKAEKLAELSTYAGQFDQYKCDEMYVTSSIGGYKFNADIRSQTNMQGLIDVLADDATTLYKDYDNEFRTMTKADLAVLKSECLQNGQYLYQQKWTYRAQINACTTKEELAAITFKFKMKDFSNE